MLGSFGYAFNAVMPVVVLIALGYVLKRIGMFNDVFLKTANRMVFRVALPALLFCNVYSIQDFGLIRWTVVLYGCFAVFVLFLLGWISVVLLIRDSRQKGVALQCAFRSNYAIIGLAFAQSIGGEAAAGSVAVLSAFAIPLFNILAVISLSAFCKEEERRSAFRTTLVKIIANPLVLGCLAGFAALLIRSLLPVDESGRPVFLISQNLPFLYNAISSLGKLASPLALLVLGGQFSFHAAENLRFQLAVGTLWRIVLAPVLGIGGAVLLASRLSFGPADFASYIGLFGSPLAVSAAVMASEMGSDEQLAGQYVVWTSIGSVATVFLTIVLLKGTGFL